MTCLYYSPPPTVEWRKVIGRLSNKASFPNGQTMIITETAYEDEGEYYCIGKGSGSADMQKMRVEVECKASINKYFS